ncbi:unnamed protein product [Mesocestoides corti]|uniref:RelA_SpoT domain-containing protein n=1 Tax=Mesocestoides corti TaxID=53468 RepID=A0A0R3UQK7_MESCO|nr:unnamed protein product [Mesocestoides corti]
MVAKVYTLNGPRNVKKAYVKLPPDVNALDAANRIDEAVRGFGRVRDEIQPLTDFGFEHLPDTELINRMRVASRHLRMIAQMSCAKYLVYEVERTEVKADLGVVIRYT